MSQPTIRSGLSFLTNQNHVTLAADQSGAWKQLIQKLYFCVRHEAVLGGPDFEAPFAIVRNEIEGMEAHRCIFSNIQNFTFILQYNFIIYNHYIPH